MDLNSRTITDAEVSKEHGAKAMKKINRVLLVYPNQRWLKTDLTTTWNLTPYTVCLLATMIRDFVEVKIVDAQFYNMGKEDFIKEVKKFNPDLAGVSLLSSEYAAIGDMTVEMLKNVNPNMIVVVGGVHVTTTYWRVMENQKVDYAIRGEGEYVFRDLIKYLNGEGQFPPEGIIFRKDGKVVVPPAAMVQDLDALPYPDYSLIDYSKYTMTEQRYGIDSPADFPYARFPTTRGCPVGCSFCQVPSLAGKKIRMRSAANIIKELEFLVEKYGVKSFIFEDDNAFFDQSRTKELLKMMIDRKLNLKWKATGVFLPTLDEEMLRLMAESGCIMLNVAIESGTERVLREVIGKPINLKTAPEKIALAKKYGLYVAVNFIIGLPTETWNEIRETLHYAETCGADYVKIFLATPLFGTKMYELAKKTNWVVGDEYAVSQRYSIMKGPEYDPKDLSILRVYEWDRINFADPAKRERTAKMMGISLEELDKIRLETRKALIFE